MISSWDKHITHFPTISLVERELMAMMATLYSIPSSVFEFQIAAFIESSDLLSIRTSSKFLWSWIHERWALHYGTRRASFEFVEFKTQLPNHPICISDGSDEIWKRVLIRDFQFSESRQDDPTEKDRIVHHLQTLAIADDILKGDAEPNENDERNALSISVFGFRAQDSVITADSGFTSWRQWKKASHVFYRGSDEPGANLNGPCKWWNLFVMFRQYTVALSSLRIAHFSASTA